MNTNPSERRKYALVTGGNKGIGFAICQGLLAAEFDVILAARSIENANTAIEKLQSDNVHPLVVDVSDDDSIDRAAKEYGEKFTHLDVLINNAGIYPDEDVNILSVDRELLDRSSLVRENIIPNPQSKLPNPKCYYDPNRQSRNSPHFPSTRNAHSS
jgi:NAD(P)-dependent dehydrogenase (short-subunit alcohol dehydrogenase family)